MHLLANEVRRACHSALFLFSLSCFSSGAASYFVAPDGLDSNPGTNLNVPWRTLAQAANCMGGGDICWIRGGTYRETLRPLRSGTPGAPILFEAYSNEVVTVSGADVLTGWAASSNGVYTCPVTWSLGNGYNQVFVDGEMVHQARLPAFGRGDLLHPATVAVTVDNANQNLVSSAAWGGKPDNYYAGAWFCGGIGERWSWQTARVVSSSGNTLVVDTATKSNPWFAGNGIGYLWGLKGFLTTDNQWHLESRSGTNILYLRVAGGEDPTPHEVEMKRRDWCIDFNNQKYITIRGLQLEAGAVNLNGVSNFLENCEGRFLSHFMSYVWGYAFDGGKPAGGGVAVSGTNNTVRGCTLHDTAGSGILSSGARNLFTRNLIYNTDYSGTYACAIRLNSCEDQVSFNTAHSSGRDILHCGGAGHAVCFNDFSEPGVLCRDLGVLYIWGVNAQCPSGAHTRIAYNWFHDNNLSGGPSPLIYLDNWCRNFVVDHNVLWNSAGDAGIRINAPASGHRVYNNTLFNCDDIATHTYDMWPANNPDPQFWTGDQYQFYSMNNLFLGASPQSTLVNCAQKDFRLRAHSAATRSGAVIAGYTENCSSPTGLGAYENQRPFWKPGVAGWCQPRLNVSRTDPYTLLLTAPPGAAYFQLMTSTNGGVSDSWTAVTNPPVVSSTQWSVSLPVPVGETRFFRLQVK